MATIRTAWSMFKAIKMLGADDRGDLYQFAFLAWDLAPGEMPLHGWRAIQIGSSKIGRYGEAVGNLVLTSRRLLWEPGANHRAAFGEHGIKLTVNLISRFEDVVRMREPREWLLRDVTLRTRTERNAVVIESPGEPPASFSFAYATLAAGNADTRAEFIERVTRSQSLGRLH